MRSGVNGRAGGLSGVQVWFLLELSADTSESFVL
jgi:hypothetical protein